MVRSTSRSRAPFQRAVEMALAHADPGKDGGGGKIRYIIQKNTHTSIDRSISTTQKKAKIYSGK
jgi:hypothetical protein